MATIALGRYADTRYPCERDVEGDLRKAIYAIGTQGTGKSTLLANLAERFAGAGEGVLVIDTKGELAEDIAARTGHPERLVYVAPGIADYPSGKRTWTLNPLEFDRGNEALEDIAVANLLSLFERMGLARLDTMTQVRALLENGAYLSFGSPEASLRGLLRLFYDGDARRELLLNPALGETVRDYWQNFAGLTEKQRGDRVAPTVARVNGLLTAKVLGRLLSHPVSTVRLAEWLDAGKLVVCNLGKGVAPKNALLLGNLFVAHLINQTYARPIQEGRVWRAIVDEFHEIGDGRMFADLITQGRKYRVFPVLAHQNLSQLGDEVANAVSQCPVRFFLKVSAEDRPVIRRLFGDETAAGLSTIPTRHARVHLSDGVEGFYHQEFLQLPGWWAERDDAQLAAAVGAADDIRYTLPVGAPEAPRQRSQGVKHTSDAAPLVAPAVAIEEELTHGEPAGSGPEPLIDEFDATPGAHRPPPRRARRVAPQARRARPGDPDGAGPARLLDEWPDR